MPIVTFRIDQNTLDELDEEESQYSFSNRAEYLRHLIDNRDIVLANTQSGDVDVVNELQERLDDLEGRVDELESDPSPAAAPVDGDRRDDATVDSLPERPESAAADRVDVVDDEHDQDDRADQAGDPTRQEMLDVIEDVHIPGTSPATERTRREAVKYAWTRLREEGEMQSRDLANDAYGRFYDDGLGYPADGRYAGFKFWDNCLRDAIKELPGVIPPEPSGRTWRYQPKT